MIDDTEQITAYTHDVTPEASWVYLSDWIRTKEYYLKQLADLRTRHRYRSAVSGFWYSNPDAAGTVDRINFDGVIFERNLHD